MLVINGYAWEVLVEEVSEDYDYQNVGRYSASGTSTSVELAKPYCQLQTGMMTVSKSLQTIINDNVFVGGYNWFQSYCPNGQPMIAGTVQIQANQFSWSDQARIDVALDVVKSFGGVIMTKGGYVQNTAILPEHWHLETYVPPAFLPKKLIINYRYPYSPNRWNLATAQETIMQSEILSQSVKWDAAPQHSQVYCHGEEFGIVLRVYRSVGNVSAPMLSHRLIQRREIGEQAGRNYLDEYQFHKSVHTITTPLPPYTNPQTKRPVLLVPGCFVDVFDYHGSFRGLVTGVSVDVRRAETTQTLTIERSHV
jgi:hypothetical protein